MSVNEISAELKEKPYACAISNDCIEKYCSSCAKPANTLRRCSKCQFVHYCNAKCQSTDWEGHKAECKRFRALKYRPADSYRLALRILVANERDKIAVESSEALESPVTIKRNYDVLLSNTTEMRRTKLRQAVFIEWEAQFREYYSSDSLKSDPPCPSRDCLFELYGKINTNCFTVTDFDLAPIGMGLYLNLSAVDHSCDPNGRLIFNGMEAQIVCIKQKDLTHFASSSVDFSKIQHSYIYTIDTLENRRGLLQSQYYFNCECNACLDTERNGKMVALFCDHVDGRSFCDGYSVPDNLENTTRATCVLCKNDVIELETAKIVVGTTIQAVDSLSKAGETTAEKRLQMSAKILSLHEHVLSRNNIYRLKFLRYAYQACIELEKWSDAVMHGQEIFHIYRVYLSHRDPMVAVHLRNLAYVCIKAEWPDLALEFLATALQIIDATYGVESDSHRATIDLRVLALRKQEEDVIIQ